MKKLNASEAKCHCYGIPNYIVVVQKSLKKSGHVPLFSGKKINK